LGISSAQRGASRLGFNERSISRRQHARNPAGLPSACAPHGSIILNASIVATKGWANWSVYSATKAAVRSFARTWSSDLRGQNIRVNAISPGVIPTPGHEKTGVGPEALASFTEYAVSITPLARTGTDEEVAKVVAFLASDDSSFVAGSELFIDGGLAQI
jgi:NAD(P)-dependent dehydrogenase (short-subunit alcohol dehydrogenase family)